MERVLLKLQDLFILVLLLIGSSMVQDNNIFRMEMSTEVNIRMVDLMVLVHINGKLINQYIKVVLKMD